MKFNNNFIRKEKKLAFLVCRTKLIKFYKKNNWLKLKKNQFKFYNGKNNNNAFLYNHAQIKLEKKLMFYLI